jgi:limonene-1,2-epoxide hydrolase
MMHTTGSAATYSQSIIADHPTPMSAFPPARFQALQLVQSDPSRSPDTQGAADFRFRTSEDGPAHIDWARAEIAVCTGQPADAAVSAARHAACLTLFEHVARVARPQADWRERVDHLAMHPIWGYVVLAGVFLVFSALFSTWARSARIVFCGSLTRWWRC